MVAGEPLGVTEPWINTVIHRVMPVVMLADWLLLPPGQDVAPKVALAWLAYPLAYAAYTLIRGPLAGDFYPYPFIDLTDDGGLGRVLLNCAVLAVLMAALALLLAWLANRLRRTASGRSALSSPPC